MTQEIDQGARTPPQDMAAEQALLGAMMMDPQAVAEAVQTVQPGDFYRPIHETVFSAILDLYTSGEPVDPVTVANRLSENGDLTRIGGHPYVHTLYSSVAVAANAGYYAEIVRDKATLRRVVEAGTRIVQMGYGADDNDARGADADDVLGRAQAELLSVAQRRSSGEVRLIGDVVDAALEEVEAIGAGHGVTGLSSGFTDLDAMLHGFHPGQLIIVAARPSIGKSTLAIDFLRAAAIRAGQPSVMFSLEMGRSEIAMKVLAAEARVALHAMRGGTLSEQDWARIASHLGTIAEAPLFIDDTASTTVLDIRAKARRLKAERDLRLIVVDYLQLMSGVSKGRDSSRQSEVSEMSRSLKLLAKELEVPVIALSQLNRNPEGRTDKKPMLSDLRESGAIEQDADTVLLLHREDFYDKESPRAGEADVIVAKQRNGPTGSATLIFQGHYSRFMNEAQGIAGSPWS